MEFLSVLSAVIGGGIVWYLDRSAKASITKEAWRESGHVKTLDAIEYELKRLDSKAKEAGYLSEKNSAFMSALYARWFDLQNKPSPPTG